jgi:hypothetical protein
MLLQDHDLATVQRDVTEGTRPEIENTVGISPVEVTFN